MKTIKTESSRIRLPDGSLANGKLVITPNVPFEYDEGAERRKVIKIPITVKIKDGRLVDDADQPITASLSPTEGAGHDTTNVVYYAHYILGIGARWKEAWMLPETDPAEQEITSVTVIESTEVSVLTTPVPGPKGMNWQRVWDGGTVYAIDDGVEHDGSSYICTTANTNQAPPNIAYWDLFAGGGGDMSKSVYDPDGVSADAFNMVNMTEAINARIMTDLERSNIAAAKNHLDIIAGNPHGIVKATIGLANVLNTKHNVAGAAPPAIGNDSSEGYTVNSLWLDLVNTKAYICLDATTGAAVWVDITQAGGGGGGGEWSPIITKNASISSLIAFDNTEITPAYDDYKVEIRGLVKTGASNGNMAMYVSDDNGTSFLGGIEMKMMYLSFSSTSAWIHRYYYASIGYFWPSEDLATGEEANGYFLLENCTKALNKFFEARITKQDSSRIYRGDAVLNNPTIINYIKFSFFGGNTIDAGEFTLYGRKKA